MHTLFGNQSIGTIFIATCCAGQACIKIQPVEANGIICNAVSLSDGELYEVLDTIKIEVVKIGEFV